jgi:hypothetical protein
MQKGWYNSVNISEGTMALSTLVPFVAGESARVQLTLHTVPSVAESGTCQSKTGHLGVRLLSVLNEPKCELQVWLSKSWTRRFQNWLLYSSN